MRAFCLAAVLLLASACSTAKPLVTYDLGDGWTRSADAWQVGPVRFDVSRHGASRCFDVERPEGLMGAGLVPGVQDVDAVLRGLAGDMVRTLSGSAARTAGGLPHDTPPGHGARVLIAEAPCIPADLSPSREMVLDLRGYAVPDGVAVVFLAGTLPPETRDRILSSVRVTR
jgi:hypothetical protein